MDAQTPLNTLSHTGTPRTGPDVQKTQAFLISLQGKSSEEKEILFIKIQQRLLKKKAHKQIMKHCSL